MRVNRSVTNTGTFLIAIAGPSGSGKTSLAESLLGQLPDRQAVLLSADRYYRDLSHLSEAEREKVNFDDPEALAHKELAEDLKALRRGEAIDAPNYDFATHTRTGNTTRIQPVPYVIVEGIFLLAWESCRDSFDLKVFASASHELCLQRRLARDVSRRGRDEESITRQYESMVRPMCDRYVLPSASRADIVVDAAQAPGQSMDRVMDRLTRRDKGGDQGSPGTGVRDSLMEELAERLSRSGGTRARLHRWFRIWSWILLVQTASAGKRGFDFLMALILLIALSPILLVGMVAALADSGRVFASETRAGRFMRSFQLLRFAVSDSTWPGRVASALRLRSLPVLLNIVRGDLSFVGPRAIPPQDIDARERAVRKRAGIRPGLLGLWWLRQRGNVDYGTEWESDGEYVDNRSFWGDFGIALRSGPALLLGGHVETAPPEIRMLGLRIDNVTMDEAVENLVESMLEKRKTRLCFVNADCANIAYRNEAYRECLGSANLVLADGIGMKLAGKALRREIRQNVNGTDLFPLLLAEMEREQLSLYLLGAMPGVAEAVAEYVHSSFPGVRIAGFHHGFFTPEEELKVVESVRATAPDCLLVGFGAPRQDLWTATHIDSTGATVAMGIGGLLDFYSGRISRAPQWMREIGMEWFYRFMQEPRRMWRRYFVGNVVFLWRVMNEALEERNAGPGSGP